MIFVKDVAEINFRMSRAINLNSKIYNVGTGVQTSNNEILKAFTTRFPSIEIVRGPSRIGDVKYACADINRLKNDTTWKSSTDLASGLLKTWNWWGL
jgi:nucleoside-diphosphate-sugar epimerase